MFWYGSHLSHRYGASSTTASCDKKHKKKIVNFYAASRYSTDTMDTYLILLRQDHFH